MDDVLYSKGKTCPLDLGRGDLERAHPTRLAILAERLAIKNLNTFALQWLRCGLVQYI